MSDVHDETDSSPFWGTIELPDGRAFAGYVSWVQVLGLVLARITIPLPDRTWPIIKYVHPAGAVIHHQDEAAARLTASTIDPMTGHTKAPEQPAPSSRTRMTPGSGQVNSPPDNGRYLHLPPRVSDITFDQAEDE